MAASSAVPFVVSRVVQIRRTFMGMPAHLLSVSAFASFLPLKCFKNQKYRKAGAGCGGGRILGAGRNGGGSEDFIQKVTFYGLDVKEQGCG